MSQGYCPHTYSSRILCCECCSPITTLTGVAQGNTLGSQHRATSDFLWNLTTKRLANKQEGQSTHYLCSITTHLNIVHLVKLPNQKILTHKPIQEFESKMAPLGRTWDDSSSSRGYTCQEVKGCDLINHISRWFAKAAVG